MPPPEPRNDPTRGAARSGKLILGTQVLRMGVRVGGTMTLARLVSPSHYGLYGMAATVHGLVYVFQDLGLATLAIRKPDLSEQEKSSLFWLNASFGAALSVAVAAGSPLVAAFFREPSLRPLLSAMGLSFLINGLHTQLRAQLAREHRFPELNIIEIVAFTGSTAIAIGVGAMGGGAWALASMLLGVELLLALGTWRIQSWRPGAWPGLGTAVRLVRSGASLSLNEGLRYAQRNLDQLLVGKWLGAGPLGLYGRASQVAVLPALYAADPLANLVISTLRRLGADPDAARAYWRRLVTDLCWITMPASAVFLCLPVEIVTLLLGDRWAAAAAALRGLAPAVAVVPVQLACAWVFMAHGSGRRMLANSATCVALLVAACLWGRAGGIATLAGAVGVAGVVWPAVSVTFLGKGDWVRPSDALRSVLRPAAASLLLAAFLWAALRVEAAASDMVRLGSAVLVGLAWAGLVWAWPSARAEIRGHFLLRGA